MRRADARFILPRQPLTAMVLVADQQWSTALAEAGIEEVDAATDAPELVIAPPTRAAEALSLGAPMVLIEGPTSARAVRSAGYGAWRYLAIPNLALPEMILPAHHPAARRYALDRRGARKSRVRRLAFQAAGLVASRWPRRAWQEAQLTLASRIGATPATLRATASLGLPDDPAWYVELGSRTTEPESRLAFLAFPEGGRVPTWAVKASRIGGATASFDRDERATELLRGAAPALAWAAPRVLGRAEVDGRPISVETAALGDRLHDAIRRHGTAELTTVHAICAWLIELATTTRLGPEALHEERTRLESVVAAEWGDEMDVAALVRALPAVPAVMAHGDPGCWNITRDGASFHLMDWETVRRAALPLWDLTFFLTDACATLVKRPENVDYLAALFRGETELSSLLFEQVRRMVRALDLPPESVGILVTLCWLDRGAIALAEYNDDDHNIVRIAKHWMSDPALGPGWSAWQ